MFLMGSSIGIVLSSIIVAYYTANLYERPIIITFTRLRLLVHVYCSPFCQERFKLLRGGRMLEGKKVSFQGNERFEREYLLYRAIVLDIMIIKTVYA